jgi:hypothetical protein
VGVEINVYKNIFYLDLKIVYVEFGRIYNVGAAVAIVVKINKSLRDRGWMCLFKAEYSGRKISTSAILSYNNR